MKKVQQPNHQSFLGFLLQGLRAIWDFLDIYSGNRCTCPNCGNTANDEYLYVCRGSALSHARKAEASNISCKKVFCESCGGESHVCPTCGSRGDIIGKIDQDARYYNQTSEVVP